LFSFIEKQIENNLETITLNDLNKFLQRFNEIEKKDKILVIKL
jgi:hypothetical protein